MGLIFRDYQKGDMAKIKRRPGDMLGSPMHDYELPAWTGYVDGKAVGCIGLLKCGEGIYTLWAIVSDEARGHGLTMAKFGREKVRLAFEFLNAHRVQAAVRAENEEYNRFIKMLGFDFEGCARQATSNKQDMHIYSRIN